MYTAAQTCSFSAGLSKQERVEKALIRFTTFRNKLFSLANFDEGINQLWYEQGEQVRQAHPTAETKELLLHIVKAVWQIARTDGKLSSQVRTITLFEMAKTF